MRIGVIILPDRPWAEAAPLWRRVEELGYSRAWTYDHLVWGGLPDHEWHSTVTTLTAAALSTSTLRLGTWVSSPNFRHPATFARDLTSLSDLSGGRIRCAVGSGGTPDATILGDDLTRGQRTRRFAEFVDVLDRCLTGDHIDHNGDFYTTRDFRNLSDTAPVPLLVAANGPKGIALAAERGQGWVTTGIGNPDLDAWWRSVSELTDRHREECRRRGVEQTRHLSIDAAPQYAFDSIEFFREQYGRAAELGFDEIAIHHPRAEGAYAGDPEILDAIAEEFGPDL